MGKAQSKRSVDITTETKKGAEDEITEKMEKIEDLDKKEVVNGDATTPEKNESEKKDTEDIENDKDMTTEKNVDAQASGNSAEQNNSPTAESANEEGSSATAEEISPLADESIKKSKKEKVKKKWSFRSISFGKKDKQKPAKNEEAAEEDGATTTNGATDEKTSPETEESQKDQSSVNAVDDKSAENHENGNATEQELKEQQTEEKSPEEKSNDVTANTTNNTITTETSAPVQNDTAAVSSESSEKTEKTAAAVTVESESKIAENATIDDASKNGNGLGEEINASVPKPQATDATESVEASAENKSISAEVTNEAASTNGDVDKVHHNGTIAESEPEVEQHKAQIEVNTNTDNKASAATLDTISSTSINPLNVQVHAQDLNESSERLDNNVQIDDESNIQKSIDIGVENYASHSLNKSADTAANDDNADSDKKVESVVLSTESVYAEKSCDEKIGDEPSPPPLPISPPPSQVSVFAFTNTNNEESVEDSIKIEKSELELPATSHIEEQNELVVPPSPTIEIELSEEITTQATDNPIINEKETKKEDIHVEDKTEKDDNDDEVTDQTDINQFVHVEANDCEDMPLSIGDVISTIPDITENLNKEEASLAAAVVEEITDKAVEIVNRQLLESIELLEKTNEPSLKCEEQNKENGRCNELKEILVEDLASEFTNNVRIEKDNADQGKDTLTDAVLCELTNSSQESSACMQATEDTDNECSLKLYAPETVQQEPNDDEMISFSKSDNLDAILEEHFNPTKEFANAKDLKENVAVAEITQDLSVTCE